MSWGPRWSQERLDQFRQKQHLKDFGPREPQAEQLRGYAGEANAADIPILTDAVSGPGAKKPKKKRAKRAVAPYFQSLCALLRPLGIPDPTPEYRFCERMWRFDFAWPAPVKLALEIDGGLFIDGGHNRGQALLAQYAKQNAAVLQGWRLLRYSPQQLAEAARDVAKVFGK